MKKMRSRQVKYIPKEGVVVMAGAGLSAGPPSSLPGWYALNERIGHALSHRLTTWFGGKYAPWFEQAVSAIDCARREGRFPPEYQAQVIEEMCGEDYFRALQALDIDAFNDGHAALASLAAVGGVRAIVTTNFDRLIEHALNAQGVSHTVAYNSAGYMHLAEALRKGDVSLPVIKIHGCVCDHRSMIDTLKQRKRGRSAYLQACIDLLLPEHWLYLGFSADDLVADKGYLGMLQGASSSKGGTYVVRPDQPELREGAKLLMDAYGPRGNTLALWPAEILSAWCVSLGAEPIRFGEAVEPVGLKFVEERLYSWAENLCVANVALAFAAILESLEQGERAFRLLDRIARQEGTPERNAPSFARIRFHHGRLGSAWGRAMGTVDLDRNASNISVECLQNLLCCKGTAFEFAALSHLPTVYAWLGKGAQAIQASERVYGLLQEQAPTFIEPLAAEQFVDAWLSATQVMVIDGDPDTLFHRAEGLSAMALEAARIAGDVVRAARVVAMRMLVWSTSDRNVDDIIVEHSTVLNEAARAHDPWSNGFVSLARGRNLVGIYGLTLHASEGGAATGRRAHAHLTQAEAHFFRARLDAWIPFCMFQRVKALVDMGNRQEASELLAETDVWVDRFPIWSSHRDELYAQLAEVEGANHPRAAWENVAESARRIGLTGRVNQLKQYLSRYDE